MSATAAEPRAVAEGAVGSGTVVLVRLLLVAAHAGRGVGVGARQHASSSCPARGRRIAPRS
ncbi:hypothetical protein Cus16_0014 [Curtobacterium sp. ER1/6]|nr:hypothetical protein Cus16_0014 [Curtobacterium sp. ER1/6]